jgi:hypothetical protein
MPMSSTLSRTQSRFSGGRWISEPSVEAPLQPVDLDRFQGRRPSPGKRASRAPVRFLTVFCIGVAATLAWQSSGDTVREIVASSSPKLVWLAPAAPIEQAAPARVPSSPDMDELKVISQGLAVVRQGIDQLAAGQQQITREIARLQAINQDSFDRISAPPSSPIAAPARRPVPLQAQPVR